MKKLINFLLEIFEVFEPSIKKEEVKAWNKAFTYGEYYD